MWNLSEAAREAGGRLTGADSSFTRVVTDSRGDITAVNDAVQKVLGFSPEELVGQSTQPRLGDHPLAGNISQLPGHS